MTKGWITRRDSAWLLVSVFPARALRLHRDTCRLLVSSGPHELALLGVGKRCDLAPAVLTYPGSVQDPLRAPRAVAFAARWLDGRCQVSRDQCSMPTMGTDVGPARPP